MKIRKYKNGNFAVKRELEYDLPLNDSDFGNGLNLIGDLVNSGELDFDIAGEPGCANNYVMYHPLYNAGCCICPPIMIAAITQAVNGYTYTVAHWMKMTSNRWLLRAPSLGGFTQEKIISRCLRRE